MSRIFKNKNFLQLLCSSNKKQKKVLIENASSDQIKSICEIIINLLRGNIKLDEHDLEKLRKKKKSFREIVKKGSIKRRKYLIQKGGFIQYLIPALVSGLATVLSSFVESK